MQRVDEYSRNNKLMPMLMPWLVCLSASLFFFYEFIQGNMFASIADDIMRDFHVQADKLAYLSSAYYVSNVLFLFIAGYLFDHFSTRRILLIAMLLCIIGTFILAHAQSFYLAICCRLITGVGSAFCFLGPVRLASRWFPAHRMAMITGAIITMAMTGGMMAQYPLAKLVSQVGWRDALMQVGWLGCGMLVIMYFGVIDKANQHEKGTVSLNLSISQLIKTIYLNSQTIRAALYTSLMNMGIAIFGAMMGTLYLVQRLGITKEEGSIVNLMLFVGAIIGGPVIGWFSDKLGRRILPMKLGVIFSLTTILLILFAEVSLFQMKILFFLLGFFTAAQIISYALIAEASPPAITARAVSMVSILTQGGYIAYQNLYSKLLVQHSAGHVKIVNDIPTYLLADFQFAALIIPIGLVLAFLLLLGLKETYCKQSELQSVK